jgi:hypothetical protein
LLRISTRIAKVKFQVILEHGNNHHQEPAGQKRGNNDYDRTRASLAVHWPKLLFQHGNLFFKQLNLTSIVHFTKENFLLSYHVSESYVEKDAGNYAKDPATNVLAGRESGHYQERDERTRRRDRVEHENRAVTKPRAKQDGIVAEFVRYLVKQNGKTCRQAQTDRL